MESGDAEGKFDDCEANLIASKGMSEGRGACKWWDRKRKRPGMLTR